MSVKEILIEAVLILVSIGVIIALIKIAFQLVMTILAKTGIITAILPVGYYIFCNEFAEKWMSEHHTLWLVILIVLIALAVISIVGTTIINIQSIKERLQEIKFNREIKALSK